MKYYNIIDIPIEIYGLSCKGENGNFWRLPYPIVDEISEPTKMLGRRNVGGRVRFQTNSNSIHIKMTLKTLDVDVAIPLWGSAGADVYEGIGVDSKYIGFVAPDNYNDKKCEKIINKSPGIQQITINMPRNEHLQELIIGIDNDAEIFKPIPYTYEIPILYYGSSITEGGCSSRPGNCYTSMLSRWLDIDYMNLGFSGSAKGEKIVAEFISKQNISIFMFDYDHNAPDATHLEMTHENFYQIIRKANHDLPIVIMTRPDFAWDPIENYKRREVIRSTYDKAIASGDKNVYFIDGENFYSNYGNPMLNACSIDGCHPNDLGFLCMTKTLYPIMLEILKA